ncbi:hypothetical protein BIV23_20070 [Streptomyces monashensis]|uniref:Uncharacterized protein n=1 Tax=Streptomyces monashensis TaxID=1678012 RepID=A0A1S2QCJ9_9ACTN|nr:hypothetical protein BIV23_20070 [Streptomyces monashensis]
MRLISIWASGATIGASISPMRPGSASSSPSGQGVPAQGPPATVTRPAASRSTRVKLLSSASRTKSSRRSGGGPGTGV